MKKQLITVLFLVAAVLLLADVTARTAQGESFRRPSRSRTEVIAYQETFETGATGWTFSPTSGTNQLWHVDTVNDAPSPTHAMVNQNASGTYNPSMLNYLISPSITLPLSGGIKADLMMKGNFDDPNNPPTSAAVTDYWYWDISPDNGLHWYRMSNPYNDPNGINYVFIDAPSEWSFVTESYTGLDGLISDYAGYTVKFRICFKSDADTPIGTGIMIDNFTIYNDVFLPPPTNLTATLDEENVDLAWTAPPSGFSTETITSTNSDWTSYVSDAESYAMKIVNPFDAPLQLHGVKFMLYRQNSAPISGNPNIHVYSEAGGFPDLEIATVMGVTNIPNWSWKEVDITSFNVMIPANGAVFVGISNVSDVDDQGLLCDSTSTVPNSFALFEGIWDTLGNTYDGLSNCALAGTYWVDDPFAPVLTGFKVYHSLTMAGPFDLINTIVGGTNVSYEHTTPVAGQVNYYYVTGVFDTYESEPSNVVSIDLIGLLYTEIFNDDGTSDQNFNLGASASSAVKFVTDPNAEIFYSKVYLNAVGNSALIIRIYDADGTGGLPGTMLLQYTAAVNTLAPGWNNLPLPLANIVVDPDGVFYIAVVEYASAPTFALDTNNTGHSWKRLTSSGAWTPITEGDVMIRALVSWGSASDDYVDITPVSNLNSYPNPFVQQTDISFDLKQPGPVSVNIYNLKGQLVRCLTDQNLGKGSHVLSWDGKDDKGATISAGLYFCRITSDGVSQTRKLVRTR